MKRKILFLFLLIFAFFSLVITTACNDETKDDPTADTSGAITKETLEALVFEDASFEYDGQAHSIEVQNVPEGVEVSYRNNGKTNPGEYTVTAIITYEDLFVKKTAKISISYRESVITAASEQVMFIYGNKDLMPNYTINNKEQEVELVVYKDGKKVDKIELLNPGTYEIEITAKASKTYSASSVKIKVTVTNSVLGLSFSDS